jgi:hypothetical protein
MWVTRKWIDNFLLYIYLYILNINIVSI